MGMIPAGVATAMAAATASSDSIIIIITIIFVIIPVFFVVFVVFVFARYVRAYFITITIIVISIIGATVRTRVVPVSSPCCLLALLCLHSVTCFREQLQLQDLTNSQANK